MTAEQPLPTPLPKWRRLLGIVGVVVGAGLTHAIPVRENNLLLLAFVVSVVWGCVLMAPASGANAVARHGGVGLISGFAFGIGVWDPKAGFILGLIGGFVGAMLGLIVGIIRLVIVESLTQANQATRSSDDKGESGSGTDVQQSSSV